MLNIIKISLRNLMRYKRRTFLVTALIAFGVMAVQVFISASGSYKSLIVGQITDAMLGHIQIHKKGYMVSIENVPLNLNMKQHGADLISKALSTIPGVEAFSTRIRLGGMISNYTETTNLRLYGISPEQEYKTVPLLPKRILSGSADLKPGQILVPSLLAKGLGLKPGDPVVIIATNKDGSVNGKNFMVSGILDAAPGPGGRDGYISISDAVELLRMEEPEISEIAIRIKDFDKLNEVYGQINESLAKETTPQGKLKFEVHTWESLSPFANIVKMVNLMSLFIKIILIAIVLISVMDVMMMSVYERIREIGTLAAIGTPPAKLLWMFITEGVFLSLFGAAAGNILSYIVIYAIRFSKYTFAFGMREGFILDPHMTVANVMSVSLLVVAIAVIGSLQPAFKASRVEPIKALKSV